jgi:hypothetical protein
MDAVSDDVVPNCKATSTGVAVAAESAFHGAGDFWVGVSGEGVGDTTILVVPGPDDGSMPIDERNERSLSYEPEIEKTKGCKERGCLLFRDWSTKRCKYGITLLTSFSKASKRGALSSGIADLLMAPGLLNTPGATLFSELHATCEVQAPLACYLRGQKCFTSRTSTIYTR